MTSDPPSPQEHVPGWSIALIGAATLAFEILLTRIFSVTLWYHFAFVAISLALFGIAASGVAVSVGVGLFRRERALLHMGLAALAFGVTTVVSFLVDLELPLAPFDVPEGGDTLTPYLLLGVKFLVLALPFFSSGLAIALAFTHFPRQVHRTYFADLAGGGLGCLLVVPLLLGVSAPSAVFVVAALALLAAALLLRRAEAPRLAAGAVVGALACVGFQAWNEAAGLVEVERVKSYQEDQIQEPERPKVYERWHPVSRVAVHPFEHSGTPQGWFYADDYPLPFPPVMEVTNDAGARTFLYPRMPEDEMRRLFAADLSDLVYGVTDAPEVLVVGLGGGKDMLSALAFGASKVVGVEMNPLMVELVQEDMADFTGAPYDDPRVEVVIDEGRNYVASRPRRYDVIKISVTDTWAASAMGAYALTESYLYTVEALRSFYDHLEPGGFLSIVRWYPQESLRLVRLAHEALVKEGDDVEMLMVRNRQAMNLILKRGAFTADEVEALRQRAAAARLVWVGGSGDKSGGSSSSRPADSIVERLDAAHRVVSLGGDPSAAMPDFPFALEPPTDDRPFFFNPVELGEVEERDYYLLAGYAFQHGRALALLLGLLKVSSAVALAFVVAPLLFRPGGRPSESLGLRAAVSSYFLMLGLGFLLVEIPMLQQFILFLGHPTYAVAVVLFALLVSSGCGSLLAGRVITSSGRVGALFAVLLGVLMVLAFVLSDLLRAAIGWPFGLRVVAAVLVLAPLGLLLGMPFPLGVRAIHGAGASRLVPWAWAVNGAASVVAPVVATLVAIVWGFSRAFTLGTLAYLVAALLLPVIWRRAART